MDIRGTNRALYKVINGTTCGAEGCYLPRMSWSALCAACTRIAPNATAIRA
jgi:hypothetical protein